MPSLRICFPTGDRGDHQEYQIKFRDVLMWRQAMGLPPRPVYRVNRREAAVVPRNRARVDSMAGRNFVAKRVSRVWARFSRRYETVGPPPHRANLFSGGTVTSSHGTITRASSRVATIKPSFHGSTIRTSADGIVEGEGENAEEDEQDKKKVGENRRLALDILEGRYDPVPNREYSGTLKHAFQNMYDKEKVTARVHAMRHRMSKLLALKPSSTSCSSSSSVAAAYTSSISQTPARGWALLRNILTSELSLEDREALPGYIRGQKAMLLFVDQVGGEKENKMRVRHRRNLDACAAGELDAMLESIEARGWRDVIWITASIDDMPMRLVGRREVKVFEWGVNMI